MVAVSIEMYESTVHLRRFLGQPANTTSGRGQIIDLEERRVERARTTSGPLEPENRAVALRSMSLSADAAAAMESMLADPIVPAHTGEALLSVSAAELLRRLGR